MEYTLYTRLAFKQPPSHLLLMNIFGHSFGMLDSNKYIVQSRSKNKICYSNKFRQYEISFVKIFGKYFSFGYIRTFIC